MPNEDPGQSQQPRRRLINRNLSPQFSANRLDHGR
jgi:hypothetical protein